MVEVGDVYIRNDTERATITPHYIYIIERIDGNNIFVRLCNSRGEHSNSSYNLKGLKKYFDKVETWT